MCDQQAEVEVHALCVRAFMGCGVRVDSRHITRPDNHVNVLTQVTLVPDGLATTALERLVVQLAREPGVRKVCWHLYTEGAAALGPPTG
ncbi:hypothetical protein [Streptomyces sp. NPDC093097]|uniref:hypothetical protein n=1 Tax=Streptomyces sp. NPDC093097 TaxID=3366027 RepID=UPI00382E57DF